jgi:hypothetical protein
MMWMLGLVCVSAAWGQAAETPVRIEHVCERTTVWAGQEFRTTLRVLADEEWLREHALQPFARELGLPVQVQAPWLSGQNGLTAIARAMEPAFASSSGQTFALGEAVARMDRVQPRSLDGREWLAQDYDLYWRAESPGEVARSLRLEAPTVRVAWASTWREDAFQGRMPLDRRDELWQGNELEVQVLAPPEAGRPLVWEGAIGRHELHTRWSRDSVAMGESVELRCEVTSQANLTDRRLDAPQDLRGLRLLGQRIETHPEARVWVFELEPTRVGVVALQTPAFAYFDPEAGAYHTWEAQELRLEVVGAAQAKTPAMPPAGTGLTWWWYAAGAVLAMGLAFVLRKRRATSAVLLACLCGLSACRGPELVLVGHDWQREGTRELPRVTMRAGTAVQVVEYHQGGHAYAVCTTLEAEQPGLIVCEQRQQDGQRTAWLHALQPGHTRVHYLACNELPLTTQEMRADLSEWRAWLEEYAAEHAHTRAYVVKRERCGELLQMNLAELDDAAVRSTWLRCANVGWFDLTIEPQ